jgi:hypothetical protein
VPEQPDECHHTCNPTHNSFSKQVHRKQPSQNSETQQSSPHRMAMFQQIRTGRVMYTHARTCLAFRVRQQAHRGVQRDRDSGILAAAWPRGGAQRLQTGGESGEGGVCACNRDSEHHHGGARPRRCAPCTVCTYYIRSSSESLPTPQNRQLSEHM